MAIQGSIDEATIRDALRLQQEDPDAHDRSLIVERLGWTAEEANAAFLRFYLNLRPEGPMIRD